MPRSGKTARGERTRARVVDAAMALFDERGYLDATMASIAAAAGVSVQTLYVAFGSKVAILSAVHDRAVDADDGSPVLERPWVSAVRDERDGRRALEVVIGQALGIVERVSPVYRVIQGAAADGEVAELLDRTKAQRHETLRALAGDLSHKAGFAPGLSAERAADVLYALVSDELYRLLVVERGWPVAQWKAWSCQVAASWLFPSDGIPSDGWWRAVAGGGPSMDG